MGLLNNDIVQITFVGSCFNQLVELIRNYVVLGDFPLANSVMADLDLINTAVTAGGVNDIETPYLALLPPQYSCQLMKSQKISGIRSAYRPLNFVGGAPGTNAGTATSVNRACALTTRTALSGKKQRGTVHVGPIPDAACVGGNLTAVYQGLLVPFGTKLLTSFSPPTSGSLLSPILYHRDHTWDLLNSIPTQVTVRTQRRRTLGVGK